MNVSLSDMNSLSFDVLKKMQDVNADLEIARRVVKNDSLAVNFFLEEFSIKILDYIGKNIIKLISIRPATSPNNSAYNLKEFTT